MCKITNVDCAFCSSEEFFFEEKSEKRGINKMRKLFINIFRRRPG